MAPPLRVLQIVPSISPVYGGPSQMVRGFAQALAEAGAEVTVLTTDSNGDVDQPPLEVPLNQPVSEADYTVWYFRCAPFRRYKFSAPLLSWLWQHAHDYDIAHIHALFSPVSTAAATVARWRRLPYLLRPLGTLDPADLAKKQRLKQIYAQLLERPNLAGAAGLHFTSPQEAEVSERFGTQPASFVIPLGVNAPPQLPEAEAWQRLRTMDIPDYCVRVLFLSRLDPKKGLERLIDALSALQQDGLEFHFILAGGNPQDAAYEQKISDRIANSPLAGRTTLTGFVTGDDKATLLQTADLFVLPSDYENFGIAVAEAMLAGLAVVISRGVYIWPEIEASQSGWVCDSSAEALSQTLRTTLSQAGERKRRGRNARDYAESHFSWQAIATQTLDLYRQVLGDR